MRILMVASEAAPFAKTGGLADVAGALPVALRELGHEVAVVMPRYRSVSPDGATIAQEEMPLMVGAIPYRVRILRKEHRGVPFFFVDAPDLFVRDGGLYDNHGHEFGDNALRFAVFSLAALGVAQLVWRADILHCHDWQAALVPVYRHDKFWSSPVFYGTKTVLTIHNLGYQGRYGKDKFWDLGLGGGWLSPDKLEYYGDVNLLKGGIMMADALTTVSPTYAREIQTPEFGFGLDGVLRTRAHMLTGIINGVDYHDWNPETDRFIASHYSESNLSGKMECKRDLLREFGLPGAHLDRPLIGIVSRFAEQKGFDLIAGIAHEIANQDVQFVVLGSGDWRYERLFRDWAHWLPHKVGTRIGYDNKLSHKIEAGADIFLMPSRYEPCGLNQIYSLRYGTVPVVRATGGLDDTIQADTGFKFEHYTVEGLVWALREALKEWWGDQEAWRERMRHGMRQDFSWEASAREYVALYQRLMG